MRIVIFCLPLLFLLQACSGTALVNMMATNKGEISSDVRYGGLERQKLDIYDPSQVTPDTPVLLYFHGGSWNSGSKDQYKFLGAAFAGRGVQTVVANYRLYPDVTYPAFVNDAAAAIAYTKTEIAGDRPLYIMGHSAGAHIAALALTDPKYLSEFGTDACAASNGFIGVAGPYDFIFNEEIYKRTFPQTPRTNAKPITHAGSQLLPPFLLLHGTEDEIVPLFRSKQMRDALQAGANPVTMKSYEDVGHINILGSVAPIIRNQAPTFEDSIDFIFNTGSQMNTRC